MNPGTILDLARAQGPIFWIAAAAMALGATMLVVAVIQVVRQHLAARPSRPTPTTAAAQPPEPAVTESAPPIPPVAASLLPTSAPTLAAVPAGDCSLALLLRRLQSAGDRLEEIAGDLRGADRVVDESVLKEEPGAVEYVFRASGP